MYSMIITPLKTTTTFSISSHDRVKKKKKENFQLFSCVQLFVTTWTIQLARLLCPWDFPGKNTGVGCSALLQGIFPTQGSNPGLLHCRQMLYPLSHQGSPIICRRRLSLIYQVLLIQCSLGVRLGRLSLPSTLCSTGSVFTSICECMHMLQIN